MSNDHRISRRALLRALGAAGGTALLAACGAQGGAAGTPAGGAGAATAPAQAGGGEQAITMLWTDNTNARQPLIADFTKATGIKVNQTQVEYGALLDKINTAIQGGGDIDVIEMDTIWTAQFASAGWVENLSGRITDSIKRDVPESSLSAVTYQGKLYGMPWYNSAKHLYYNAKLLREAGFSQPPATLDEFVAQAKATTKPGGQWGSIWSWKQAEGLICDWVAIMFAQKGAQFLDKDGRAVFNTMGGAEALQWMYDLLYTHKVADPASLESTEDDVRKAFFTGKYALISNWEGLLPSGNDPKESQAAPNVRVGLLPGGSGGRSSSVNGSEGWAILAQSKRKDLAWRLLEYMASPAWQKKSAQIAGDYPVLASLYSDPDLQKGVQDFAIYGEQFKYLAVRPQVPGYAQKSDIIQTSIHRALLKELTPQAAMDAAAEEINKVGGAP